MNAATGRTIRIRAGEVEALADLNAGETAAAIWDALPFTIPANTWGDEIYFTIPVGLDEDDAQPTVALGDLGYWPPGRAFCIFFGPTPMSSPRRNPPGQPRQPLRNAARRPDSVPKRARRYVGHRRACTLAAGVRMRKGQALESDHVILPVAC